LGTGLVGDKHAEGGRRAFKGRRDCVVRLFEGPVRRLTWEAEGLGKICGTDKDDVDCIDRRDLLECSIAVRVSIWTTTIVASFAAST
jgi:hypothetical protein